VITIGIISNNGKVLMARQYVPINKSRIEGLLSSLPRLIGSEERNTQFIETENVRFLYQPLDTLYVVVVTNRNSNIVEDLDTLTTVSTIVNDCCKSLKESDVIENAFELIFAFDELITLGYKEKLNLDKIKTFTTMYSRDEQIHDISERNRIKDQEEVAKRKARDMERERREYERLGISKNSVGNDY